MNISVIFNIIEAFISIFKSPNKVFKILSIVSAVLLSNPVFLSGQLAFTGAGVLFQPSNGYPLVSKVMLFSPAADGGIQNGEIIWSVDGKSTQGLAMNEVSALIKGNEGAERRLVVGGDKREVIIKIRKVSGKCTKGDCINGEGRIEEPNGSVYIGEFENGKFTWGSIVYSNGDRYEGFFANGMADGEGKYFNYVRGFRYKGDFKADKYQGRGSVEFFKGGAIYEGIFQANEPIGEGKLTFSNGTSKIFTPKSWGNLLEEATGQKEIVHNPTPQPSPKPAPKRDLTTDDDSGKSEDFSALINLMKSAEQKFSNAISAYPAFRNAYKIALDKSNGSPERATEGSTNEFKKFLLPFGEGLELMKNLKSTIGANKYFNERQNNAFKGWGQKMGEIIDLFRMGKKGAEYTASACYWMNMNVDKAKNLLDEAGVSRRAF